MKWNKNQFGGRNPKKWQGKQQCLPDGHRTKSGRGDCSPCPIVFAAKFANETSRRTAASLNASTSVIAGGIKVNTARQSRTRSCAVASDKLFITLHIRYHSDVIHTTSHWRSLLCLFLLLNLHVETSVRAVVSCRRTTHASVRQDMNYYYSVLLVSVRFRRNTVHRRT